MGDSKPRVKPSEQRGGTTPDAAEAREKGEWAGTVADGMVPPELGGSDASREMLADDPELGSAVLGRTTGSDEPATDDGIDLAGGNDAGRNVRRRPGAAAGRRGAAAQGRRNRPVPVRPIEAVAARAPAVPQPSTCCARRRQRLPMCSRRWMGASRRRGHRRRCRAARAGDGSRRRSRSQRRGRVGAGSARRPARPPRCRQLRSGPC